MTIELSPNIRRRVNAFREKAEKAYDEFVLLHVNDTCDFAGSELWSLCQDCKGLYHEHNPRCTDWKWLWTMSVGEHDDRI